MSNQLSVFNFKNLPVHTNDIDGKIWFLANDVCSVLQYSNPRDAIKRHCKERGVVKYDTPTSSGIQSMAYINEPNLFRLIVRSKKEEAVDFENWVFEEVLPSIRKTGSYSLTINTEQQQAIKQAINERHYRTGEHYQAIYHKLYECFKIPRYQDLPANKFEEAIKFLGGVHIKSSQFTDDELCTLAWCYKAAERMRQHIVLVTDAMYQIKSEYAPSFYSMGREYARTLENARVILERETQHIVAERQGFLSSNWANVFPNIRQMPRLN